MMCGAMFVVVPSSIVSMHIIYIIYDMVSLETGGGGGGVVAARAGVHTPIKDGTRREN